ncbi:MAG: MFS transporter [bacterium]|nr:MFS transporter [bacterium]
MFQLPKIEKITRDATIVHFSLLFGYKVFSLYFPLFLVNRGFSLPEVGYTYLLIYLPIALFSPLFGFLNHKVNPAVLAGLGILGYGIYALAMILVQNPALFYFFQVLLGISAAAFFVSARAILMGYPLENPDRAFGWFYSAPFYADAIAPAVGAFFVWQFGFVGVFAFSLVLQFFTAFFCILRLRKPASTLPDKGFNLRNFRENQRKTFSVIKSKAVLPFVSISLSVLFLAGLYRTYFVLFLKDEMVWSQNLILIFISVFSLLFLPFSLFAIRHLGKYLSEKNVFGGGLVAGLFSILFGLSLPFLNFLIILLINLGRSVGSLVCGAGRSGLLNKKLKDMPEEAGAVDTIFAPLGVALGAFVFGLIIDSLGYGLLFILSGLFVLAILFLFRSCQKGEFKVY